MPRATNPGTKAKTWKNITLEEGISTQLGIVGTVLTEKLGFRPSLSQTILFLIKHYERTENK